MTDVLQGTYADLRFIRTRSVAQLVIEIPIEQAGAIVDLLGVPKPGSEVWVAVARLQSGSAGAESGSSASRQRPAPNPTLPPVQGQHNDGHYTGAPIDRPRGKSMTEGERAVQRAGILPSDAKFRQWAATVSGWAQSGIAVLDGGMAEDFIRERCGVKSRREIATDAEALAAFLDMEASFNASQPGRMAERIGA